MFLAVVAEVIKEVTRQSDISQLQIKSARSFQGWFPLSSGAATKAQGPAPAFQGFGGSSKIVAWMCTNTVSWWTCTNERQHKSQSCLDLHWTLAGSTTMWPASSEAEDGFVLRNSRFVEHQFVSALNADGEPVNEGHTQIKVVLIWKS